MDILLFYSNNCKYCNSLKDYKIYDKIKKVCVDNMNIRNKIPKFITSVPSLMIKENDNIDVYMENELHQWFQQQDKYLDNNQNNNNQHNENNNEINYEDMKKSNKNDNEMLEASNQLLGGFSSGFSFMEEEENDKIDGGSYCSLDSNINIQTIDDTTNIGKDGSKKDISSKYEELMKEREGEFKGMARLG
jgi:hypothetical protein